jgi:anti-sigma factor RsiW
MSVDDADLLAYVDNELPPERRAEVETAVAGSADLAGRLRALRASDLPYAAAFEAQALPPVPDALGQRIADLVGARPSGREPRLSAWPRLAAAFAAGVVCCAVALRVLQPLQPPPIPVASASQVAPWIKAVADYQELYSRATLANVREDPLLSARVILDLQTNDGLKVLVPDLRSVGLAFKRVQRLSFRQQAVVQMAYLPAHGEPVAVCVTRDERADAAPLALKLGDLQIVSWRRNQLGYVLVGRVLEADLLEFTQRLALGDAPALYSGDVRGMAAAGA